MRKTKRWFIEKKKTLPHQSQQQWCGEKRRELERGTGEWCKQGRWSDLGLQRRSNKFIGFKMMSFFLKKFKRSCFINYIFKYKINSGGLEFHWKPKLNSIPSYFDRLSLETKTELQLRLCLLSETNPQESKSCRWQVSSWKAGNLHTSIYMNI